MKQKQKRIRDIWNEISEFDFLTYEELTSELGIYNLKQLIRLEVEMVRIVEEREERIRYGGLAPDIDTKIRQGLGGLYKTTKQDILKCIRETPLMKVEIRNRKLKELGL